MGPLKFVPLILFGENVPGFVKVLRGIAVTAALFALACLFGG